MKFLPVIVIFSAFALFQNVWVKETLQITSYNLLNIWYITVIVIHKFHWMTGVAKKKRFVQTFHLFVDVTQLFNTELCI
jgi:hypothetical protein